MTLSLRSAIPGIQGGRFHACFPAGKGQARHPEYPNQAGGARGLIDRAAKLVGKNRTDFVLDAARQSAEDALLDHTAFEVSPKAYAEFLARLDAPAQPNELLRRSLVTPASWE